MNGRDGEREGLTPGLAVEVDPAVEKLCVWEVGNRKAKDDSETIRVVKLVTGLCVYERAPRSKT